MGLLRIAGANPLAWWWAGLSVFSAGNIALWFVLYRHRQAGAVSLIDSDFMLVLCAAYVFGCAFRAVLPRADVQRICLFDTWLSSVVIGRSVATVAELCFAAQWALFLALLAKVTDSPAVSYAALVIVPLIAVAQCLSWYGVLTTNYLANALENSIWALTFAIVAVCLCTMALEFEGVVRSALVVAIIGIVVYLVFLAVVDVPMYFDRWKHRLAEGGKNLTPLQGLRDVSTRWVVTHDLAQWKGEIAWMTLYFTAAVWASLALCMAYSHADRLPEYRAGHSIEQIEEISIRRN